jgi:hypothetical protein
MSRWFPKTQMTGPIDPDFEDFIAAFERLREREAFDSLIARYAVRAIGTKELGLELDDLLDDEVRAIRDEREREKADAKFGGKYA